mgnify:CR=1 FL=1
MLGEGYVRFQNPVLNPEETRFVVGPAVALGTLTVTQKVRILIQKVSTGIQEVDRTIGVLSC